MNESDQQWTDTDFQSPPERSLAELTASLRERVANGLMDGPLVDDLRLFILVRLHQGVSQLKIEEELTNWGLDPVYAVELVCSTRSAGNVGGVEVYTELFVNGISAGRYNNPTYDRKVRAANRVERLARQAARMAEAESGNGGTDLGFDLTQFGRCPSQPMHRRNGWRRTTLIVIVVAIVGSLIVLGLQ